MAEDNYQYIIVGGGLAGASAIEGIREHDSDGTILLLSAERHMPYNRPPLSKGLWLGKKKPEEIFVHGEAFYSENNAEVRVGREVQTVDPGRKTVTDGENVTYGYKKLLLATGGVPRALDIPGHDLWPLCYYRYIDDYLRIRQEANDGGRSALIVGGGFIGSEMAAALRSNNLHVTMLFPEEYLVSRVFPETLGRALQSHYESQGIKVITEDVPTSFKKRGDKLLATTKQDRHLEADIVIIGAGIRPAAELAQQAGLDTGNGVQVNEFLQTSNPDIYAAGDLAEFPYAALNKRYRIEHWDNALNQGKHAGRNMAGAQEPFTYMPYFFSDLFEFGYEAVGEVNTQLETFADWQKENDTGIIYYLRDSKVRGVMLCNVWEKVDAARELIRHDATVSPEDLKGAIQ